MSKIRNQFCLKATKRKTTISEIFFTVRNLQNFGVPINKRCLFLYQLHTLKEYRNKGIATKIIKKIFQFAMELDINYLVLYVANKNKRAFKLYSKFGFTIIDEFNHFNNKKYFILQKTLERQDYENN